MKLGIKMTTADKIGLGVAGAVVWVVGILPTAIGGGVLYHYRKGIKEFFLKRDIRANVTNFINKFTK